MPNYYNPYNYFPVTYQPSAGYSGTNPGMVQPMMPNQQSFVQQPQKAMEWVEGEVGAKAFQMPSGWPANQPIPLWDSTDTVIYLKSWGPMGIPNPMQKLHYEMPEAQNQAMIQGGNGMSGAANHEYMTKDDLKELRDEIQGLREVVMNRRNQNGSNNGQMNKGGGNNA